MTEPHAARIERMSLAFDEAMRRFIERLESAGPAGDVAPADGGWSAAQIGLHVALVNEAFAGYVSGTLDGATRPSPGFVERPFAQIAAGLMGKLKAPEATHPGPEIRMTEALVRLRRSADRFRGALATLDPERGSGFTLRSPITGEITLYQVGEWAVAHVIRHNAQAKRMLQRTASAPAPAPGAQA